MINTEELTVIDGHKLNFERDEFPINNDIRDIYDFNLSKSLDNCKTSMIMKDNSDNTNTWSVNVNFRGREIIQIQDNIYEIVSDKSGLSFKLFGSQGLIFKFETDNDYKLPPQIYGKELSANGNNLKYYTSADTCVISNDLNNKILKYSSSENINNHIYTKYYEFVENTDISIYLLLIDFIPYRITVYFGKKDYDILNFSYK